MCAFVHTKRFSRSWWTLTVCPTIHLNPDTIRVGLAQTRGVKGSGPPDRTPPPLETPVQVRIAPYVFYSTGWKEVSMAPSSDLLEWLTELRTTGCVLGYGFNIKG